MRWLLLVLFLPNTCLCLFSQSVISGRVTENENEAIEFALVTLKQVSDSDFVLTPDAISLQEVIVKGRKTGVFFDKDTIRYDISSFKDGSEVVLGDLLNKLPGIEVDEKGSVKAHGKQVDKLLLNGQDFFQGNAQMATKNLSANIAESIEILNNYSEYSILSGFQNHEKTVINVGVNKNKLGKISGNLSAGGGMKNKYEFRGDLMQLSSTWMTSIIGAANNNGNEIFSIEDYISLQGGVTEFIGNQEQQSSITLSEEEQKLLVPRNNVYERNSGLAGMNFSYQPKKSFKINSYLLYNDNKEFAKERNQFIYFLPEQRQYETSNNLNINNKNKLFSGFVKMNYQPSSLWDIVYKGQFSTTGIFENTDATNWLKEQQIHAAGYTSSTSIGTKQNIAVMKSFNKHLLISEVSFLYDDKPFSYEMQSDSLLLPIPFIRYDDYYYGKQDTKQKNTVINANFSFFYKLNESYFLRTGLGFSMTEQAFCSGIYQMNQMKKTSLLPDENLKNDYSLHKNDYNFNLNLTKNKGLFRFKAGASVHAYDFIATGMPVLNSRKVVKLNPAIEMSLYFSDKHTLSLSGYKSYNSLPTEAFLSGIVFDSYQSYSHNSRVNKLYSSKYNLNLSYRIFDIYYNTMLILVGGYNRNHNTTTINYYSDGLLTERQPILSVPTENMYAHLYASKGLGVIPWTLKLTGKYNENSFFNQSANKDNIIKVRNVTEKFQIVTNYRQVFNMECKAELELIDNSSLLGSIKMQTIQRYSGKLKFNFNKRFWANAELEHVINQSLNIHQRQWYLNALICYKLNDKVDINLSGQNMLHLKNQEWVSVSYNGIYVAERNFRQIPGNLLLKLNYRF